MTDRLIQRIGDSLHNSHLMPDRQHICQSQMIIGTELSHSGNRRQHLTAIASDNSLTDSHSKTAINSTQHSVYIGFSDLTAAVTYGLIGKAQSIAHTAICSSCQRPDPLIFITDTLFAENKLQMLMDTLWAEIFQIKLQASGQYGDRKFLRIGGGKQKFYMGRRLLQGL